MKKQRQANIELLRIIAMLLIILLFMAYLLILIHLTVTSVRY